jgi:ADP-ribosylglycohydrolase
LHDVLDPRDLVPDEAEQLLHSGYAVDGLLESARSASTSGDYQRLAEIERQLGDAQRSGDWPYVEPSDPETLGALAARLPRLDVDPTELADRLYGAWLGRCVANTMGKPVEGLTRREVEIYLRAAGQWPQTGYIPLLPELPEGVSHLHESAPFSSAGTFDDVPRDDDIDWTILNLSLLEQHGTGLSTAVIAAAWLDKLPFTQTFTAERAAYRNVIRNVPLNECARVGNPYREWIGALIRADVFGYVHPGDLAAAVRLGAADAQFSHVANGIYGEMWAAALVSAAFTTDDARVALAAALPAVPEHSRLAEALRGVEKVFDSGVDAEVALDWADQQFGHYNWVHTINNSAHIAIALLWGRDFTDAIRITVAAGSDTDSSAATVGSVFGALHGSASIPPALVGTTHVHVRSAVKDFDRITIKELAGRTLRLINQRTEES